ncbi:carboxypeptidase-like regulatory domain-containing protein, partial [Bacteroidales bacterium OttesenSCG-928-I21]|nr:carboxypeptidase-like regulatory domain-containing protein [Bacteroidales bacterium OttesenSCG-928-I21]
MNITQKKKILGNRKLLLLITGIFISFSAMAQVTVKGMVSDAGGETIIGANVIVKGTTNGTITDFDGNFTIEGVNAASDILVVSYIGYHTKEIPCKGKTSFNIVLDEDTKLLDEVVVIGYGQVRKGDATGSLTSVKVDAEAKGFAPNAQDMLVGKVAGVNITSAGGSPTGGSTIRIRGGSSLNASNDPLIIVDGVPIDNYGIGGVGNILSTINPSDIE